MLFKPRFFYSLLVVALFCLSLFFAFKSLSYDWNWLAVYAYREKLFKGWLLTLFLSAGGLVLSTLFGLFLSLALSAHFEFLKVCARFYVELIRGTPFLVQILIGFYGVAQAVGLQNRYVAGLLLLSIFSSAYMAEIFRSGFKAVGASQRLAARAIGLSPLQSFQYVVFPQTLRVIAAPMAGQFASLIKDSSLLSIIAISEFSLNAQEVNSFTYSTFETYIPLALGYLVLTLPLSMCSRFLEKRWHFEN